MVVWLTVKKRALGTTIALLSLAAGTLVGCGQQDTGDGESIQYGSATPADSPAADHPAGTGFTPGGDVAGTVGGYRTMVSDGHRLALRGETGLAVGSVGQLEDGSAFTTRLDKACGDVSATVDPARQAGTFVLACPAGADGAGEPTVYLIDAKEPSLDRTVTVDHPVTNAAVLTDGRVVATSRDDSTVTVTGADGRDTREIKLDDNSDRLIAVPVDGGTDGVVSANRKLSKIAGISLPQSDAAYLRGGRGFADMRPAGDQTFIVTDALENELMVFTIDPVVRLHQTAPVDPSPWGLFWDADHQLAWVSSTAANTITGYSIAAGVPVAHGQLSAQPNVRAIAGADGHIVTVSADSPVITVIDKADVARAADQAPADDGAATGDKPVHPNKPTATTTATE
ncbi:hypothetical protein ACFSSC_03690 [Corynebacterium mendelii]